MFILTVPPDDDFTPKAKLDGEKIDTAIPKSSQKVELDLDDSPFLDEEEEEELPPPRQEISVDEIPLDVPPPATSKKKVAVIGIIVGVLFVAIVLTVLLTMRKRTPAQFKAPTPEAELVPAEPKQPPPPIPEEKMVTLAPFTIEFPDKERTRFLTCKFVLVTSNEDLIREVDDKMLFIRDGIYYFLKNKSVVYLTDRSNSDNLKNSLLTVVNQYLSTGQIKTIWIEDYLVK